MDGGATAGASLTRGHGGRWQRSRVGLARGTAAGGAAVEAGLAQGYGSQCHRNRCGAGFPRGHSRGGVCGSVE